MQGKQAVARISHAKSTAWGCSQKNRYTHDAEVRPIGRSGQKPLNLHWNLHRPEPVQNGESRPQAASSLVRIAAGQRHHAAPGHASCDQNAADFKSNATPFLFKHLRAELFRKGRGKPELSQREKFADFAFAEQIRHSTAGENQP